MVERAPLMVMEGPAQGRQRMHMVSVNTGCVSLLVTLILRVISKRAPHS
jgi:hypothetical protein